MFQVFKFSLFLSVEILILHKHIKDWLPVARSGQLNRSPTHQVKIQAFIIIALTGSFFYKSTYFYLLQPKANSTKDLPLVLPGYSLSTAWSSGHTELCHVSYSHPVTLLKKSHVPSSHIHSKHPTLVSLLAYPEDSNYKKNGHWSPSLYLCILLWFRLQGQKVGSILIAGLLYVTNSFSSLTHVDNT